MSKARRSARKPLYIILGLSLVLSVCYVIWNIYLRPTPLNIMAIEPVPLEYGETTLTGILSKDSPVGQAGQFILTLADMRVIYLDVRGVDTLLGESVKIQGILIPPEINLPGYMVVKQITLEVSK